MRLLPAVSPADRLVDSVVYQSLWILGFADLGTRRQCGISHGGPMKLSIDIFLSFAPWEIMKYDIISHCRILNEA